MGSFSILLQRLSPSARLSRKHEESALRKLLLASNLFDARYYLEQYPDVAAVGFDAATHYIRHGGQERRNPSAHFDASYYLANNADLKAAEVNPLVHYLRFGMKEGRSIRPVPVNAPKPVAPPREAWAELASLAAARKPVAPRVDIIIPAYRGFDETANCIEKVLRSRLAGKLACEIVVIDDDSPEEKLSGLLNELDGLKLITLLRNRKNRGFVASVNRGMELHKDRDVILLNSDTEVFGDWVERLQRAAYSKNDIGTVTPFSNNATICGYPIFAGEFAQAFEVSFEEMDRLASEANAGQTVEVPTGVGFCMYIRRECLREAGLFDAGAFGRGYGEENEFSLRIASLGWRNVLAGDVYVRHIGRVSFLDSASEHGRLALQTLQAKYPSYLEKISTYIESDPPKRLRQNLDLARIRRATGSERSFLFVLHGLGGGTLKHAEQMADRLSAEGIGVMFFQPLPGNGLIGKINVKGVDNLSVLDQIDIKHGLSDAVATLRELGVVHIHVHHLMGFTPLATEFIPALAAGCGARYDVTLHDYYYVCPRVQMIDASETYCANSNLDVCELCIKRSGSPNGDVSVWQWRELRARLLDGARAVYAPDEDVRQRFKKFLPSLTITLRPHPEAAPNITTPPVMRLPDEPLRVAVIGAIGPHKGSLVLQRCAEDALRRRLPIEFIVVGYTDKPALERMGNVNVTGAYHDEDLPQILERVRCHMAFLPSVWPETYSYTLSEAYFAGLYPVAFDLGALAHRIRQSGWGHLLPTELFSLPGKINDALLSLRPPPQPRSWQPVAQASRYNNLLSSYYGLGDLLRQSRTNEKQKPVAPMSII